MHAPQSPSVVASLSKRPIPLRQFPIGERFIDLVAFQDRYLGVCSKRLEQGKANSFGTFALGRAFGSRKTMGQ